MSHQNKDLVIPKYYSTRFQPICQAPAAHQTTERRVSSWINLDERGIRFLSQNLAELVFVDSPINLAQGRFISSANILLNSRSKERGAARLREVRG